MTLVHWLQADDYNENPTSLKNPLPVQLGASGGGGSGENAQIGTVGIGSVPAGGVPYHATSGLVANEEAVATIPASAGLVAHVQGFSITPGGATAGVLVEATLGGVNSPDPLSFIVGAPTGATVMGQPLVVNFGQGGLAAIDEDTPITLTLPALGAGNTHAAVSIWGYTIGPVPAPPEVPVLEFTSGGGADNNLFDTNITNAPSWLDYSQAFTLDTGPNGYMTAIFSADPEAPRWVFNRGSIYENAGTAKLKQGGHSITVTFTDAVASTPADFAFSGVNELLFTDMTNLPSWFHIEDHEYLTMLFSAPGPVLLGREDDKYTSSGTFPSEDGSAYLEFDGITMPVNFTGATP